jgi:GAF domain-containing protein/CheY-like chemotaxis protein
VTARPDLARRQAAFGEIVKELAREDNFDRLCTLIGRRACELVGGDAAIIALVEGDEIAYRGSWGLEHVQMATRRRKIAESRARRVLDDRRTHAVSDMTADPVWRSARLVTVHGFRAIIETPIVLRDVPLGVFGVLSRRPRPFDAEDETLLASLAEHMALALDRTGLLKALEARLRAAETLVTVSQAAGSALGVGEIARRTVREMVRALGADMGGLWVRGTDTAPFVPLAGYHVPKHLVETLSTTSLSQDREAVRQALAQREPTFTSDSQADPRFADPLIAGVPHKSILVCPLRVKDQVVGGFAIVWTRDRHRLTGDELRMVEAIAAQAAIAIESVRALDTQAGLARDNARLLVEQKARLRETETLLAVSQAVSSTLDPTETMRRVAREIAHALGADTVGAYVPDAAGTELRPIAGYHVPAEMIETFLRLPITIAGHAPMQLVWSARRPAWSNDAARDARIPPEIFANFPHRSVLFVPMLVKGEPLGGFVAIWWRASRTFGAEELRLVQGISDQAAVYMENAHLYAAATRRRREAEDLARLARMLTESLDAADVGERIVESALSLVSGLFSVLRVLEPDGALRLVASHVRPDSPVVSPPLRLPPGGGVAGHAIRQGRPAWSPNVPADPALGADEATRRPVDALGAHAFLAVPLRLKGEILGVLGIGDREGRAFTETEAALLQTFGDQAAIALENSRLYGELRAALRTVEESQQRIVQGERLRALGELAGGVAHDFNNVLAIIVGRAEVLGETVRGGDEQRHLQVILKVAQDAAQTVRRIQEFTRMRRARPMQALDLRALVEEVAEVTRSRWKDEAQARGITYDLRVEAQPVPIVAGDRSEIREALTNILFNALDAMPGGGTVTLRTGVEGDHVVGVIQDTGVGMSPEVCQRIFDPFFSTKGERGTGLGLSVVYGIVTRHGGDVRVESEEGRGSVFTLRLPLGGDAVEAAPAPPSSTAPTTGRVLVIDDEPLVVESLCDLLRRDGHTVTSCTSGEAGLACLATTPFDLVITDLGMPGMSGWEVARTVKARRPGVRVAMITGWGDQIDADQAERDDVDYVVAKPFRRADIRRIVAAALADTSPGRGDASR